MDYGEKSKLECCIYPAPRFCLPPSLSHTTLYLPHVQTHTMLEHVDCLQSWYVSFSGFSVPVVATLMVMAFQNRLNRRTAVPSFHPSSLQPSALMTLCPSSLLCGLPGLCPTPMPSQPRPNHTHKHLGEVDTCCGSFPTKAHQITLSRVWEQAKSVRITIFDLPDHTLDPSNYTNITVHMFTGGNTNSLPGGPGPSQPPGCPSDTALACHQPHLTSQITLSPHRITKYHGPLAGDFAW